MSDAADFRKRIVGMSPKRLALLALELQGKLEASRRAASQPIAIVGMGCRFPGAVETPEAYWELLADGVDAVREVPSGRWDMDAFYDPDPATPGRTNSRWGGFLDRLDLFDADFFGISPREAASMDPQQRLLLEVAWEALEHAALVPRELRGSRSGVFVGVGPSEYPRFDAAGLERIDAYFASGSAHSILANRISYLLDFQGPSIALDTACSSSLVALHLACQSLRRGEVDLALAGGVNLMVSPQLTISLAKAQMLAADGRCKTFDALADGYVRGEGCGVVTLKRLDDARRDGDRVWAVVRGSAVRQDGRSSGLTAPRVSAQVALLRAALEDASARPEEIAYVEAHGTGTSLGDPIEVEALKAVYGAPRAQGDRLALASVKTNLGHLEPAAGIAGLIKASLALEHGELPPHLNFRELNPNISFADTPFFVPTERSPWPAAGRRRAAVSSFGFGGTIAHAILEQADAASSGRAASEPERSVFVLSARTPEALEAQAKRTAEWLGSHPEGGVAELAATAGAGREPFEHRLAVGASSRAELGEHLQAVAQGESPSAVTQSRAAGRPPEVVFLFTGQGSQYPGMGRRLYATEPRVREVLDRCDEILRPELGTSLLEVMLAEEGSSAAEKLNHTAFAQPALFALEVALARLWRSWGVEPSAVLGHSVGEYAAACVAGVFGLEDGLRLMSMRGRLMEDSPQGAMAAVFAPEEEVARALESAGDTVSLAAVNGPRDCVVAGAEAEIEAILAELAGASVETKRLRVQRAFHSPLIDAAAEELERRVAELELHRPEIEVISNLTGEAATEELLQPAYWRRHSREPVRFAAAMAGLRRRRFDTFLEIGPHPVLLALGRKGWGDTSGLWLPSLRRRQDDAVQMTESLGALWAAGGVVDWRGVYGTRPKVVLPSYPFERQRHWLAEANAAIPDLGMARTAPKGDAVDWLWEVRWREAERPEPSLSSEPGPFRVVADRGGVGEILVGALAERGVDAELVEGEPGPFAEAEPGEVVDLRPLDLDGDDPVAAQESLCGSVLEGVQALARVEGGRLRLVTRGAVDSSALGSSFHSSGSDAQDAGSQDAVADEVDTRGLAQSTLWGLTRVVAREMPELWGGAIDLDPSWNAVDAAYRLADELSRTPSLSDSMALEDQVALREGARRVARLAALELPSLGAPDSDAPDFAPDPQRTWLVSGGLGALGLRVARWLAEAGARHLVLVGRSGSAEGREPLLEAIRDVGAEPTLLAADLADPAEVARVLTEIGDRLPPLGGVVHCAGVLDDGLLAGYSWNRFASVLAPKVAGAWNLHRQTADLPLQSFVLFSSAAAVLGTAGQGAYAAANAFLDGLASHRRGLGLPALSVAWGPWAEAGMAADLESGQQRRWAARGGGTIASHQGLEVFGKLLASAATRPVALPIDWRAWGRTAERHEPLLAELVERPQATAPSGGLAGRLAELPETARRGALRDAIRGHAAGVMGRASDAPLPADKGLFEMGLDSLMAVELRNRLGTEAGAALPSTLILDHPTLDALTDFLALRLALDTPGAGQSAKAVVAATARSSKEDPLDDAIAVIGIGCRFPGGVDGADSYWELLRDGVDAIGEMPAERWDVDGLYDPDPDAAGKMSTRRGGFVEGIDLFDATFFGITPREAAEIDPQQRLLLETSWQALEHACCSPASLRGAQVGVFVGISSSDYAQLLRMGDPRQLGSYTGTGTSPAAAAGRLSYIFGFQGPALAIDTACSSSLVSVHTACASLRRGECELALAGGVNAILTPETHIMLSRSHMLAPDGRCKTFSAEADGYGRSEGCGMVALKRLSDCLADGDRVLAVVRGSAVNQDGRSVGLTAPNGPSQESLVREALATAGCAPAEIDYVETHGTGTPLGDPVEVQALGAALGEGRGEGERLRIGSVKTNLGHLEAAAGIAGLIKVVLALGHGKIPPHLHCAHPSPHILWDDLPIDVPSEAVAWPAGERRRRAGVSSFGFTGTNAHVVLEEAPARTESSSGASSRRTGKPAQELHLLPLSAPTASGLERLASSWAEELTARPELSPGDIAFSAGVGRASFPHRLAVVGDTTSELRDGLTNTSVVRGEAPLEPPTVAFLFTGQGAQYAGMGRALHATEPVFRETLERCAAVLDPVLGRSLLELIFEGGEDLDATGLTQPALFAIEVALAELWRSWGVEPDWVLGHSVGEFAAAVVAGVWSLEDAAGLVAERGRLMQELPPGGAMAAVRMPIDELEERLAEHSGKLSVATLNAPGEAVVSGLGEALDLLLEKLTEDGVWTKRLRVSHAFHSPLMDPVLEPFEARVREVEASRPRCGMVSNLEGRAVGEEVCEASYWRRQLRETVRFSDGMEELRRRGCEVMIEIGPQPTLLALGRKSWPEGSGNWLPSLRRGTEDQRQILDSLAELYTLGGEIDWQRVGEGTGPRRRLALPTYPFERRRHWIQTAPRPSAEVASGHPLLGRRIESPFVDAVLWESRVSLARHPGLDDHRIFGRVVVPGAYHLALILAAAREQRAGAPVALERVIFPQALILPDDAEVPLHLALRPEAGGRESFRLAVRRPDAAENEPREAAWVPHAEGVLGPADPPGEAWPAAAEQRDALEPFAPGAEGLRRMATEAGLGLGPHLQWIDEIWTGDGVALGRMRAPREDEEHAPIYFGLIDASVQMLGAVLGAADGGFSVYVPFGFESLRFFAPPRGALWCRVALDTDATRDDGTLHGEVRLFEDDGRPLAWWRGLELRRASPETLLPESLATRYYALRFQPRPRPMAATPTGPWLVLGGGETGAALVGLLQQAGAQARHLEASSSAAPGLESALAELEGGTAPRVVHLGGLEVPEPDASGAPEPGALAAFQGGVCRDLVALLQAVASRSWGQAPRIDAATAGCQPAGTGALAKGEASVPDAAPVWGLGRVAAREHPDLWGSLVDLDPAEDPQTMAAALLAELSSEDGETEIALRGSERRVARLQRHRPPAASAAPRADGTYLITGGFGALGLGTAAWLVAGGARHLVLVGRRGAPPSAADALQALEAAGAQVTTAAADLADPQAVAELLAHGLDGLPPLIGVYHAAGVLDDAVLLRQDPERLEAVLAPKTRGAWNLHLATAGLELDAFVLFSSMSGILGTAGQAAYAAGNAFLDSLASWRRGQGLPALSVAWGPWEEGMADAEEARRRWRAAGVGLIETRRGFEALGRLLAGELACAAVAAVDWAAYAHHLDRLPPLLETLAPAGAARPPAAERRGRENPSDVRARLEEAPPHRREALMREHVRHAAAEVMRLESPVALADDHRLFELGMDSLMALELRGRLERGLGLALSATLVFDRPSVAELAGHLLAAELGLAPAQPGTSGESAAEDDADSERREEIVAQVEQLSEEELDDLVNEELELLLGEDFELGNGLGDAAFPAEEEAP